MNEDTWNNLYPSDEDEWERQASLPAPALLAGVELIKAERERQIAKEGWTAEHDNDHRRMEMARAAAAYVLNAWEESGLQEGHVENHVLAAAVNVLWPWDQKWWKPTHDPIRTLVKAGALIAAEIDRLQREQAS